MTKNITAALFAVFIFAAIPTPASANPGSATGVGGSGGSDVGEGGPVFNYWQDLDWKLNYFRGRMRWLESEYPGDLNSIFQLNDTIDADKLNYIQREYLFFWRETKRISSIFSSRASGSQNEIPLRLEIPRRLGW
jgi:hypothetical protein